MTTNHHPSRIRDDCWTESATETLIESWGDRYLHLNRGNLRQNDWRDVANAVNSLRDKSKPPRTDVQCKNRIDTLKKKYKAEKAKLTVSKWPFYYKLDELIGTNVNVIGTKNKKLSDPKSITLKDVAYGDEEDEEEESLEGGGETSACGELAKSILRFGEVYERVESLKEEEVMEMEKRRIEFAREVEIRRLDMFMETQLEIEKMKMKMKMKMKKKKKKKTLSTTGLLTTGKKTEQ